MSLSSLPPEIVVEIFKLAGRDGLKNLCEVSKHAYNIAAPILYETLIVRVDWPSAFLWPRQPNASLLQYTKTVRFTSVFNEDIKHRCPYFQNEIVADITQRIRYLDFSSLEAFRRVFEGDVEPLREPTPPDVRPFQDDLIGLLENLKSNSLRSFIWETGTCIPKLLLGPAGQLSFKQNSLESIQFTGHKGRNCFYGSEEIDLSSFKCLKSLSWKRPRPKGDFKILGEVIRQTRHQLQEMDLELFDPETFSKQDSYFHHASRCFPGNCLRIPRGVLRQIFPSLQKLCLSSIPLMPMEEEMLCALNFPQLHTLKLRSCRGWDRFLRYAFRYQQQINLKSLNIQYTVYEEPISRTIIPEFVGSFDGLEELFIYATSSTNSADVWNAALRHKSTLKRFVQNGRYVPPNREEWRDVTNLFRPSDAGDATENIDRDILRNFDFECLGFCCDPKDLKSVIAPFSSKSSLLTLHVRQSGFFPEPGRYVAWNVNADDMVEDDDANYEYIRVRNLRTSRSASTRVTNGSCSYFVTLNIDEFFQIERDLHEFAEWVFGPTGIPSLQVLAVGEFSPEGLHPEKKALLCRKSEPTEHDAEEEDTPRFYRHLYYDDHELWKLLNEHSEFLEACPGDFVLGCIE
ncbi:hypothetical protein AJ79_04351 [Helicocarpus griseus UAMH5409]|uniref:F-box domain-containing protein n=1 Tax=Helicocarpus griseus UAMH5409 TaxID=1447875 RepID=A0A2B7XTL3_9EURO|nr:hypothetical protein AJ79_04351 [Helicocarpus griseus UAMH5409]